MGYSDRVEFSRWHELHYLKNVNPKNSDADGIANWAKSSSVKLDRLAEHFGVRETENPVW